MRRLLIALLIAAMPAPSLAAEKDASAKTGAPGTNVEMPFLMAPLTGADGNLSGYAYISSRLTMSSDIGANEVRDKIAFIQDIFVRDVNAKEIATSGNPATVDNAALEARLLADARRVVGAGRIVSISITQLQIAPLHPSPVTPTATAPGPMDSAPMVPAKLVPSPP